MLTSESSAPSPQLVPSSTTGGFDAQHPPSPQLIDACVHCGFCLTTCPSYRVLGKERDSPRGRIYLMDAINTGEAPLSATSAQHFDSCLGCLACTTACSTLVAAVAVTAACTCTKSHYIKNSRLADSQSQRAVKVNT